MYAPLGPGATMNASYAYQLMGEHGDESRSRLTIFEKVSYVIRHLILSWYTRICLSLDYQG